MEQARSTAVEAAVKKYRSLTPILCKVGTGCNNGCWVTVKLIVCAWHVCVFCTPGTCSACRSVVVDPECLIAYLANHCLSDAAE